MLGKSSALSSTARGPKARLRVQQRGDGGCRSPGGGRALPSPPRFPCASLPQPHRTGTPCGSDLCFKGLVTGSPRHTQCSSSAPAVSEHGTTPPHCPSCPVAFPNTARSASKKQPRKPKTKPGAAARALSLVLCHPAPALGSGLNSCSPQTPPSRTPGWVCGEKSSLEAGRAWRPPPAAGAWGAHGGGPAAAGM